MLNDNENYDVMSCFFSVNVIIQYYDKSKTFQLPFYTLTGTFQ